jgi:hypothetical protein
MRERGTRPPIRSCRENNWFSGGRRAVMAMWNSDVGMAGRYNSYLDRSYGWRAVAVLADIGQAPLVDASQGFLCLTSERNGLDRNGVPNARADT